MILIPGFFLKQQLAQPNHPLFLYALCFYLEHNCNQLLHTAHRALKCTKHRHYYWYNYIQTQLYLPLNDEFPYHPALHYLILQFRSGAILCEIITQKNSLMKYSCYLMILPQFQGHRISYHLHAYQNFH